MDRASDNPMLAIGLKLASVIFFVVMAACVKAASTDVPPGQAVFFRSFFAIPVIVAWLALRGELATGLRAQNPWKHVTRGVIGTGAMAFSFAGLALLPLSEVKAIQYATPLFVVVLAAIFLGERVRAVRLTAVALGMAGVLMILWPRLSSFSAEAASSKLALGALLVLCGSMCAAIVQVFVRRMVETEATAAIVFWFSVTASVLSLATIPFGWAMPTPGTAALLVAAGLFGGVGQILTTSAYRFADASVVSPFEYASMLLAVAIGYVFFAELPTPQMLGGAVLVIAAGVLIIFRERQLRLRRGRARQVVTKYG